MANRKKSFREKIVGVGVRTGVSDVDTPAVVVDLDTAERNIKKYQKYCDKHKIKLRPHIKTHKISEIAMRQVRQGATGITCQKISETKEIIKNTKIKNVLISFNIIGENKLNELKNLSRKINLTVVADSEDVIKGLSKKFGDKNKKLNVLVECDTGANRCGVKKIDDAKKLADVIDEQKGLKFSGLMTYPPPNNIKKVNQWIQDAKNEIEKNKVVEVVSCGGSPDMWNAHKYKNITEYRIGTYVYNDKSLVKAGVCKWKDCALSVVATVVSVTDKNYAVIDAGSKMLTSDLNNMKGYGHVIGRPDIAIYKLSEEHGHIKSNKNIRLTVGQKIKIIPNHACVVSNMVDYVVGVRKNKIVKKIKVNARGKSQ